MVAGKEISPKDVESTERLRRWATEGPGAALFNWGVPGDYMRCVAFYTDKMAPGMVHGWCQHLHERATGAPAGHAPGEEAAHVLKGHH